MKCRTAAIAAVGLFVAATVQAAPHKELVDAINPIIGASTSSRLGEGKTFPGATTPFGLVQLSPDTITGGDNGPGYSWEHQSIEGFSFTHMSGVGWYGDFGNFLVMPTTGTLKTERGVNGSEDGYRSRFHHETEDCRADYYAVTLDDYHIRTEVTAAPRAGILRFTFPQSDSSRIQIDLARRIGGTSTFQSVKVVDDHTIAGWMKCPPAGGGWGNGAGKADYTVYFYAQFSKPLTNFGVWSAKIPDDWSRKREDIESNRYRGVVAQAEILNGCREMQGKHLGFFTQFATAKDEVVLMKAGISFVSLEGAQANLQHDIPGWNFDAVHRQGRALWAKALDNIAIQGGTETQREIFATAQYHTFIDPRTLSDVTGLYPGADQQIHHADDFTYRTIFSGWDVFRGECPLLTLVRPDIINDLVNSLMQQADLSGSGHLARWEIMGAESGCMIGDPAVSVFTEAYLKGIRNYDVQKAYALCHDSVTGPKSSRKDLAAYEQNGFVPDSISWTLENAYFDYSAGKFATALDKTNDAALFFKRALNYQTIYDPSVGNMHAKKADGSWTPWQGATTGGQGCVESNPYQQGWFVPHDVQGMIDLMGKNHFVRYLTEFFDRTPTNFLWNDYYNHANEPVHHAAYLFTYAGAPWLTQKWSRFILDHAYGDKVNGLCGNDDVGQMSAWYVLSAVGFYPVSPVDEVYIIGSPLFNRTTLKLDPKYYPGRKFTVIARNNSAQNIYIQSARLNGKPLERAWLRHAEIVAGGTLELQMGPEPNRAWGSADSTLPPSLSRPTAN